MLPPVPHVPCSFGRTLSYASALTDERVSTRLAWEPTATTRCWRCSHDTTVLGVDIAKAKFDACLLLPEGTTRHKVFPNTPTGFELLTRWLGQHTVDPVHACLEATGTYGAALALYLYERQHIVSLMNPAAIKAFAASRLTRSKTDRVDASVIARFCATQTPPPWTPPAAEVQELQGLVRRLDVLVEMRTMERNRLSAGEALAAVRASITAHLEYLQQEIAQTERLIQQHIRQHTALHTHRKCGV